MGNMSNGEKAATVILGILLFPFFLIRESLYSIGILKREQHEWHDEGED